MFGLTLAAITQAEFTTMPAIVDESIAILERNSNYGENCPFAYFHYAQFDNRK